MSEDRFFQHVRSTMADYRPEVPEAVYSSVRKKLWWSNFTRLSATRFNVWYLAILLTGSVGIMFFVQRDEPVATQTVSQTEVSSGETLPVQQVQSLESAEPQTSSDQLANSAQSATANQAQQVPHRTRVERIQEETILPAQNSITEKVSEQPVQEVTSDNTQSVNAVQPTSGAKKGLKVKTYNSTNKKD
jgi:hypothetical protein